jgi:XTP/dITP diphosphohydrolase
VSAGAARDDTGRVLVIASNNAAKITEFGRLLAGSPWVVRSLAQAGFVDRIDEPGPTYADNALTKAATASTALGLPALGDDSGIEVEALHGWPGPASARWLGAEATDEDRMRALLAEVHLRTPDDRHARYVCALALARPGAQPIVAHGECHGVIVEPRGSGGFGYDPIFLSDDLGITFGEAGERAKDRVSHRAHALRRLAEAGVLDPQPDTA